MAWIRKALALAAALASLAAPGRAAAAEVTRVVSGGQGRGTLFDLNLSLAWLHDQRSASVKRELESAATGGRATVVRDLVYTQTRNLLALRADVGLYRDLSFFATLPLVLGDDRSLDFDRADNCTTAASADCVDETNSTLLRDGILPGAGAASYGIDAEHTRPFQRPSRTVFRGPTRQGIEHLGVGLAWAVLNQARDESKPTWIVRFETRFDVGKDQRFDPAKPVGNRGAGLGYGQLVWSTVFSRRMSVLEPYLGGFYALPFASDTSPYGQYELGRSGFGGPQHRAGSEFGLEGAIWEDAAARQRIAFEARGRFEMRFFGLAQGELWEPLSGSAACPTMASACRRDVDRDLTGDRVVDPNPGVTRSPSYGVLGGDVGLNVQVGRYVRFRALFGLTFEQSRMLSDGRSGFEIYDAPGRRFKIEDGRAWHLLTEGGLLF